MEPDLHSWRRVASREQLLALIDELVRRYPPLLPEIIAFLTAPIVDSQELPAVNSGSLNGDESNEEAWDFGGEGSSYAALTTPLPPELELYRQRLELYLIRLEQGEPPHLIREDLNELLTEAEWRAGLHVYAGALELYGLLIDECLRQRDNALTPILDEALESALPNLKGLFRSISLSTEEASDPELANVGLPLPFEQAQVRQLWLERLFALWLLPATIHSILDGYLLKILASVIWDEDQPFLQQLIQVELQRQPQDLAVVNFARQYRLRMIEKFARESSRE